MSDRETTRIEPGENSALGATAPSLPAHGLRTFRGLTVLEQFPTRGAEADLYLLQNDAGEKSVFKLYRHSMEPKPEVLERVREIGRTRSDCLVVLRDAGFDETTGRWFELLEYLPLGSLKDISAETRREPEFIRKLVSELAEAIHCLHREGIVHCDVKPGNVLVRSLDPLDLVLTDFGLASPLNVETSRRMTELKGTPMYRPPEAFSRMAGRPGDWWGLGMIVLELLAGEHPFAGLSEAQILHRLTVGNVEIPETAGAKWRPLLRGLLTKDDAKRWGYAEVVRWLTGRLEASEQREPLRRRPFRFEGRDFADPGGLARALCENEEVWRRATKYANYFRPWLENSGMAETAKKLGAFEGLTPDAMLARFVYACSGGPFVWLGRVLNVDTLCSSLKHAAIAFPQGRVLDGGGLCSSLKPAAVDLSDEVARRIAAMTESGELLALYDVWTALSGGDDPQTRRLLAMLKGKSPKELRFYAETLQNPENFLWPADVSTRTPWETLDALARMRTPPLRRDFLEGLQTTCLLPHELLRLLERAADYDRASQWLQRMRKLELLIPDTGHGRQRLAIQSMNLDDYEKQARVLCWRHTDGTLAKIQESFSDLNRLYRRAENDECRSWPLPLAASYLSKFTERKLSEEDLLQLNRLHAAVRRYSRRRSFRSFMIALWGAVVGTAHVVFIPDYLSAFLLLIFLRVFFILFPDRGQKREATDVPMPIVLMVVMSIVILLTSFSLAFFENRFLWLMPGLMGFIQGAFGYAIYYEWAAKIDLHTIGENCAALIRYNSKNER